MALPQIWSSAEPASTVTMCEGLSLANADGDIPLLVDIWDRSSMDTVSLPTFPVMKDLTKIWKGFKWIPPTPHKSAPGATLKDAGTRADGKQPWTAKDLHWSQYDTILIDDQRRDHVLQPNNQICVPQFKSNQPSAGASSGPARAMPGGRFGGAGKDTVMLQLVGALEALRHHSNVSAAMSLGYFHNIGRGDVQNEWASRGVKALQEKGIPVKEEFDRYWAIRLMEVGRPVSPLRSKVRAEAVLRLFVPGMHSSPSDRTASRRTSRLVARRLLSPRVGTEGTTRGSSQCIGASRALRREPNLPNAPNSGKAAPPPDRHTPSLRRHKLNRTEQQRQTPPLLLSSPVPHLPVIIFPCRSPSVAISSASRSPHKLVRNLPLLISSSVNSPSCSQ